MGTSINLRKHRLRETILWTLRITVVLQCLGNWRSMVQIAETPLLHWMASPADVGGLAWSESTALAIQQGVGWSLFFASVLVLWRPHALLLLPLACIQVLIAVAMWRLAEGYSLQAEWISPAWLTIFPFATQMMRIAAPAGLFLLLTRWLSPEKTMLLMRWSVAIVFFAHGVESWQLNPKFVDLIINACQRVLEVDISQANAEQCLKAIGAIDMALALICACFQSLGVIWWMAFWGGLTAVARGFANGWGHSAHEVLTRTPHFGVPVAVAIWWHMLRWRARATTARKTIATMISQIPQEDE